MRSKLTTLIGGVRMGAGKHNGKHPWQPGGQFFCEGCKVEIFITRGPGKKLCGQCQKEEEMK